ncbi:homoserine kinase [Cellulomonas aerilata]|uniref:Homoserine kinase n=1 Tax=Cellulomonas aerilata TaxID=515326 RepID=A0A512DE88_9CELL|nr:homoserine kinase [Cellulomonas aerilata]GEO34796.1 homoserine kinase [Cellulomonas aerilata]
MRLGADRVRVRVPATSANLGPGFDALGLALGVHDDLEFRALGTADVVIKVHGEGAGEVPDGEAHLVVRALRHALDHVSAPQVGVHLECTNRIPHGRGMGSSAAAVVAGLLAARGLVADPDALGDDVVLRLATELEGHPDNAAPAILGGATVAWCEPDGARAVRIGTHADLAPLVLVPDVRLATRTARGLLPATVPHADAALAAGRAALLVHALGHRPDLLHAATEDRLHQRYRAPAMPDSLALVDALRARGVAAVVSGAGPTVVALACATGPGTTDADEAVRDVCGAARGDWQVLVPGIDTGGATVERPAG